MVGEPAARGSGRGFGGWHRRACRWRSATAAAHRGPRRCAPSRRRSRAPAPACSRGCPAGGGRARSGAGRCRTSRRFARRRQLHLLPNRPSSFGITVRVKNRRSPRSPWPPAGSPRRRPVVDPRAGLCRPRWRWPTAGRRRARRTAPASRCSAAVSCCITGEIARRKAGICPTFSGLMASGSPSMTSSRPPAESGRPDRHGGPIRVARCGRTGPSTASKGLVVSASSEPSSSNLLYSSEMKEISFSGSKATR